jgi:hypothetical protein
MEERKSVFETLNAVNVNGHVEKKNGLSYLSWAWAWAEVKKAYPTATYTVYENKDGMLYHTDGATAWVKTGVTIEGLEHIEYLPVMDMRNKSIPVDKITSFDVNKAVQRSLTKACARHGLGLYIYAGEDLPEGETAPKTFAPDAPEAPEAKETPAPAKEATETTTDRSINIQLCIAMAKRCGRDKEITVTGYKGKPWTQLSDQSIASLKLWLVSACKGAA